LTASYKPRDYCVQYRESDFQFVSRLLEEEGIYYYFQHTEDEHRLVLADHSAAWFEIAEQEVVLPQPGHMAGIADQLKAWHSACSWQPGGVAVNDYNFH